MALNFDTMPSEKPQGSKFEPAAPGFYIAEIEKASIEHGPSGEYLLVVLQLQTANKNKIWDRHFYNSEKSFPQYKLKRLLTACGIQLTGMFEVKDIVKLLPRKKLVVDVKISEDNKGRATNDIEPFENDIYYPVAEWAALTGGQQAETSTASINEAPPAPPALGDDDDENLPFEIDEAIPTPVTGGVDAY